MPRFPVAFPPPAFASWSSDSRRGICAALRRVTAADRSMRAITRRSTSKAFRRRPDVRCGPAQRSAGCCATAATWAPPTGSATRRSRRQRRASPTAARRAGPRRTGYASSVPAIITEEVFEAAQRVKTDNSMFSPRRTTPGTWLLRGLVYCGACNVKAHAQPMRSTAENGTRKNRYYSCYHHDTLRAGGVDQRCTERRIRADELDAFVFAQVRDILLRPDVLLAGERALVAEQPAPDDEILDAQLASLTRRVDQAPPSADGSTTSTKPVTSTCPNSTVEQPNSTAAAANSSPNRPSSQLSVTNSPSATASANASPTSPSKPQTGSTRSTSTNANDCSA